MGIWLYHNEVMFRGRLASTKYVLNEVEGTDEILVSRIPKGMEDGSKIRMKAGD